MRKLSGENLKNLLVRHAQTSVVLAIEDKAHSAHKGELLGDDLEGAVGQGRKGDNVAVGPGAEALVSAVQHVLGRVKGQPGRGGGTLLRRGDLDEGVAALGLGEGEGRQGAAVRGYIEVGGRGSLASEEEGREEGLVQHGFLSFLVLSCLDPRDYSVDTDMKEKNRLLSRPPKGKGKGVGGPGS